MLNRVGTICLTTTGKVELDQTREMNEGGAIMGEV